MFPLLVSCGGSFQIKNIYDQSSGPDDLDDLGYQLRSQRPEFVLRDSGNVSAILGKRATLNCRVRNVGNRTVRDDDEGGTVFILIVLKVSWIRHQDTHLLTAGRYTYTSDERFRAVHKVLSEDYLLQIDPVQVG